MSLTTRILFLQHKTEDFSRFGSKRVFGQNPPKKIPLNAVEREPVETRVLNPNASKASYKPK